MLFVLAYWWLDFRIHSGKTGVVGISAKDKAKVFPSLFKSINSISSNDRLNLNPYLPAALVLNFVTPINLTSLRNNAMDEKS